MSEFPNVIFVDCPQCRDARGHEVLSGRGGGAGGGFDCTVKCNECGFVHKSSIAPSKEVLVPLIVSDQEKSRKTTILLEEDDVLQVGEELLMEEYPVKITAIEVDPNRRVERSEVPAITTIWCMRYDRLKIGLSVNRKRTTTSVYFWVHPEEDISIGDIVNIGGEEIVITKIKTPYAAYSKGSMISEKISRLYGRPIS